MPRIQANHNSIPAFKDKYDLHIPGDKEAVLNFEKEFMKFDGPWRWELYMENKGYIKWLEKKWIEDKGEHFIKVDSYTYCLGSRIIDYLEDCAKYHALKQLRRQRVWAKNNDEVKLEESLTLESLTMAEEIKKSEHEEITEEQLPF